MSMSATSGSAPRRSAHRRPSAPFGGLREGDPGGSGVVPAGAGTRDLQGLLNVLAPEVVVSDGGGIKQAALRPILGAEKVVRFLAGGKTDARITVGPTVVNGSPGLFFRLDGEIDGVRAARVEDARITGLYYVRNPAKLTRVASETPLTP